MPNTLVELLRVRAQERPEFRGYRYLRDGESLEEARTWGELELRARAIGAALCAMGASGTNVLLLYPPSIDFIDGYFGCLFAGATPVPAYPPEPNRLARTLPRVQAIVADAGARFALTTKSLLALADAVFATAPDLRRLEWLASDTVPASTADTWSAPALDTESLAMIQYTSGSTGTPKGVMLSHSNLLANAATVYDAFEVSSETRWLSWLPTFHDMGFMAGVLQPLFSGCPVVGMPPTTFLEKPFRWLSAMSATRSTHAGAPNFAYDLCVRKTTPEQRATLDLSAWELAFNGAETIRLETIDRFATTFASTGFNRRVFFPCYGLAEATLIVSGSGKTAEPVSRQIDDGELELGNARLGNGRELVSSGAAVRTATIVIVEPGSNRCIARERVGEIWVSGPSVGRGYWQRPEDTEITFGLSVDDDDRRYLRTGDLGFIAGDQLFVCGRTKDMIIVRGANYYPQDIELTVERAHAAIRPGCVGAFSASIDGEEKVFVVAEVDRRYHDRRRNERGGTDRRSAESARTNDIEPLDVDQLFWAVRDAVATDHELALMGIALVRSGSIHKTSSGKLQRGACRTAMQAGQLELLAEWRSDGTQRHSDVATKPRAKTPSSQPVRVDAPAPPKLDLTGLRKPRVLITDEARALALSDFVVTVPRDRGHARELVANQVFAAVVADDLELLSEIAGRSPATGRIYVTDFSDAKNVRDAVDSKQVTAVLLGVVGKQQLQAAVRDGVENWITTYTDSAIVTIEGWMATWLAKRLNLNSELIDRDAPVVGYGLDSLSIVEIQTALAEWLAEEIPDSLLRDRSSIRSVARRLTTASLAAVNRDRTVDQRGPISIVGMSCKVPGADDATELWRAIVDGEIPIARVQEDRVRGSELTRWAGAIESFAEFDAAFFGIAPRDAAQIDPQHRIVLETCWHALEDAGINPQDLAGTDTGVFVGISGSDFVRARTELALVDSTSAAAQRVSYFLNLKGPSLAIDAGDASSIAALHVAVQHLERGDCGIAIVAGVSLTLIPDTPLAYERAKLIAVDGRCRPLDVDAHGSVLADGCGAVVLVRATDGRFGNSRVRARILATALRHSGRGHGITAPNQAAQEAVLREALFRANVPPAQVNYVELDARGVAELDAIEMHALANIVGADRSSDTPCVLGAVKGRLGDARAAAGILGVIKAALVLEHDSLPPIAQLTTPHPALGLTSAFVAPTTSHAWPKQVTRRIACVDDFGLLGSNGVVVLEREVEPEPSPHQRLEPHLLCISARSDEALRELARAYAARLDVTPNEKLADFCYTANYGRAHFAQRASLVAATSEEMRAGLLAMARDETREARAVGHNSARIGFIFADVGSVVPETGRELFANEPRFRAVLQRCDAVAKTAMGHSLIAALYDGGWRPELELPATVAIECALADLWQAWGAHPTMVIGQGSGEYAAAVASGALSIEDAIVLACTVASSLFDASTRVGRLASATIEATQLAADEIAAAAPNVAIAARGVSTIDVVGRADVLAALVSRLRTHRVDVSAERTGASPLHTPFAELILEKLEAVASRLQFRVPAIGFISSTTGKKKVSPLDGAYWTNHASQTVQIDRGIRELMRDGLDVVLEISGRPIIRHPDNSGVWLSPLEGGSSGPWESMFRTLGVLYERGVLPNWQAVYRREGNQKIGLPSYPFERRRCWPSNRS